MKIILKSIIVILLICCLLDMPYGYFQFVRIAVFAGFVYLTKEYEEEKKQLSATGCFLLFILFNPFFKIHFNRATWNIIDIVLVGLLLLWIIVDIATRRKNVQVGE